MPKLCKCGARVVNSNPKVDKCPICLEKKREIRERQARWRHNRRIAGTMWGCGFMKITIGIDHGSRAPAFIDGELING
jgi:hypothetical protein